MFIYFLFFASKKLTFELFQRRFSSGVNCTEQLESCHDLNWAPYLVQKHVVSIPYTIPYHHPSVLVWCYLSYPFLYQQFTEHVFTAHLPLMEYEYGIYGTDSPFLHRGGMYIRNRRTQTHWFLLRSQGKH